LGLQNKNHKEPLASELKGVVYYTASNFKNNKDFLMRDEVQDRYGNKIYLTNERWEHIIKSHHQLNGHRAEVLSTIRSGKRRQDPSVLGKFYYKKPVRFLGRFSAIEVVVRFHWQEEQPNNFVVTAYPK